jgi:chemotaxis protein MotB
LAKNKPEEQPPAGAPAWMATYGDMVTLLLCFFVLLFAMSDVNPDKIKAVAAALSFAPVVTQFGGDDGISELIGNGIMEMPIIENNDDVQNDKKEKAEKEIKSMEEAFKSYFDDNNLQNAIEVKVTEEGLLKLTFKDNILFDQGKANIRSDSKGILDILVSELINYPDNEISIIGHSDSDAINTVQFPTNMHLSTFRAISVWQYFVDNGVPAPSISSTGKGEFSPIAPNDTRENKAKNRRVEIFISSKYNSGGEI